MVAGNMRDTALTLKCLHLYEKAECLWNPDHPDYKNLLRRKEELQKILDKLSLPNFSINDLKSRIRNLRGTYIQEEKKIKASESTPNKFLYKPSLVWFEQARRFLGKVVNIKDDSSLARKNIYKENEALEDQCPTINLCQDNDEEENDDNNSNHVIECDAQIIEVKPDTRVAKFIEDQKSFNVDIRCLSGDDGETIHDSLDSYQLCYETNVEDVNSDTQNGSPQFVEKYVRRKRRRESYMRSGRESNSKWANKKARPNKICLSDRDDEFSLFGANIACQLRLLPLENALNCERKILEIIFKERIAQQRREFK